MKKISVILLLTVLTGCGIKYQRNHSEYSIEEIQNRAKVYFGLDFNIDNSFNGYIVDGQEILADDFRSVLKNFKERDYRKIDFIKKDCKNPSLDLNCGLTVIIDTKNTIQSESEKKEILERNKQIFENGIPDIIIPHQEICRDCKLIYIDYQPYEKREAQKVLNEIKLEQIEYIAEYNKSMNPEYFSRSGIGQAGWIQIWTK
ncbi:MAG: hypothetical protein CMC75_04815 [Flavobacteriaceae bacterium]|nr:hypothetical protein [Flavobacteriaceae bacterium]|tara:strand:+ start:2732 stop:3337 length:606 start_codon:yes stop_codon:yes gene_type:complete